jgi:adenylate cyclase class 2
MFGSVKAAEHCASVRYTIGSSWWSPDGAATRRKSMAQEIEIKLRIHDRKALDRALRKLKVRGVKGRAPVRVLEQNVIFDTPEGGLARHGQLLRIRTETIQKGSTGKRSAPARRVILTFKAPAEAASDSRHKVRAETELEITDAAALAKIFEGLGLRGWFRYEKHRTTYVLPPSARWAAGLLIELDDTPIGTFLELEGPAAAIDRAANLLGFTHRDYLLKNYLQLFAEDCRRRGEQPRDMLFPKKK